MKSKATNSISKLVNIKTIIKETYFYSLEDIKQLIREDISNNKSLENCKINIYAITNDKDEIPVLLDLNFDYSGIQVKIENIL